MIITFNVQRARCNDWRARVLITVALALLAGACDKPADAPKATPPAKVANPVTESTLSTITLTPDAEKRLGIVLATAAVESVAAMRTVGGEVVVPPGRSVVVSSPMAGIVQSPSGNLTRGGLRVLRGQTLFTVFPLQASERDQRIVADRDTASAAAELQAAEQRLARLESLLTDGATSVRAVEEARAQQQVLAAAVTAGRARVDNLRSSPVGARGEIAVRAPFSGVLQDVTAAPGQTVAAGAPLFSVAQVDSLWVKVPLYLGDRDSVDLTQPVAISGLGGGTIILAARVAGPPSANPLTATTDVFFAPGSGTETLRAGERVNVQLPLRASQSGLVVPAAAVLYDMQGGTWVYESLGDHVYARRRVEVKTQTGGKALIARGLEAGQKVVTDGAAELFGTEFGAGK